jgi:hypothetical protein
MTAIPTAEELHWLRLVAVGAMNAAIYGGDSVLHAINAICDYGSARQAWHNANRGPDDPPVWVDPWSEQRLRDTGGEK